MTTTLRPTVPLQRSARGDLSRHFQVCVNGRPVGVLRLATHPVFGPSVATLEKLFIKEDDRGRGRGTVAALAAEEIAREWGCTRLETSVPDDAEAALRLTGALGYTERNRAMRKPVTEPDPVLPAGSGVRAMAADEFPGWYEAGLRSYAHTWTEYGIPEDAARVKAERDYSAALPQGLASAGTVIRILEHEGGRVGTLWLGHRDPAAFVLGVEVLSEYRGRGHGRTLMRAAEREAAAMGCPEIALNVFARNTPAVRLYETLGYRPEVHHLTKPLG